MWENFEQCEQIQAILQVFKQINDQYVCLGTNTQHITMTTKQQQQQQFTDIICISRVSEWVNKGLNAPRQITDEYLQAITCTGTGNNKKKQPQSNWRNEEP